MWTELAEVRHESMRRSPTYVGGDAALVVHRKILRGGDGGGQVVDRVSSVYREDGRALAVVLSWHDRAPNGGTWPPTTFLVVNRPWGNEAALAWVVDTLDRVVPALGDDVDTMIPAWDVEVRRHLQGLGLGISVVHTAGRVPAAHAALMDRYGPPAGLDHLGLRMVPLEPAHIDPLVALHRTVFQAEPQYCWFGAFPPYLAALRARMAAPKDDSCWRVVLDEDKVMGFMSCDFRMADPHHGTSSGMELILDPAIWGKGVAKVGYRVLLEAQMARDIAWIKGATARPGVMKLARVMGRQPMGVSMRRDSPFPPGWFDPLLGPGRG